LRILTPILKLYTDKLCVTQTSECLELFGGAGYIEDTGIPLFLRDAQVFSIWEGTTSVLSLNLLRAISADEDSLFQLIKHCEEPVKSFQKMGGNHKYIAIFGEMKSTLLSVLNSFKDENENFRQKNSRLLAFQIAEIFIAAQFAELEIFENSSKNVKTAKTAKTAKTESKTESKTEPETETIFGW